MECAGYSFGGSPGQRDWRSAWGHLIHSKQPCGGRLCCLAITGQFHSPQAVEGQSDEKLIRLPATQVTENQTCSASLIEGPFISLTFFTSLLMARRLLRSFKPTLKLKKKKITTGPIIKAQLCTGWKLKKKPQHTPIKRNQLNCTDSH